MKIEYDEQTCEINKIKIIDFGFANYLERLKDLSPEGTAFLMKKS